MKRNISKFTITLITILLLTGCGAKKGTIEYYEDKGLTFTYSLSSYTSNRDSSGNCYNSNSFDSEECKRVLLTDIDDSMILTYDVFDENKNILHYQPSSSRGFEFYVYDKNNSLPDKVIINDELLYVEFAYDNGNCKYYINGDEKNDSDECSINKTNDAMKLYDEYIKFVDEYDWDIKNMKSLFDNYKKDVVDPNILSFKKEYKDLSYDEIKKIIDDYSIISTQITDDVLLISYITGSSSVFPNYMMKFDSDGKPMTYYVFTGYSKKDDLVYIYDYTKKSDILGYAKVNDCFYYPYSNNYSSCTIDEQIKLSNFYKNNKPFLTNSCRISEDELKMFMEKNYNE